MKRSILLASCLLSAAALTACGGGNSSTTASGPPLTQPQFVAKAKQYCTAAQAKVSTALAAAQQQATANPQNAAKIEADWASKSFAPAAREAVDQIGALNPPADKQAALKAFVDQGHMALDKLASNPQSVTGSTPFPGLAKATKDLGIQSCFGGPAAGD